ncbi:hypothetical protein ACH5RR_014575 [Cinchona calisaya]|uniref:Exocyst subunit Exo70 family protein n=1 Tax=Cinchona calisaya TaxID=153742 RepID=A0ABD3A929_9GENT
MDSTEKEKPLLEKSTSIVSKPNDGNNPQDHLQDLDDQQDPTPKKHESCENAGQSPHDDQTKEVEAEKEWPTGTAEEAIKELEDGEPTTETTNVEEPSPLPPDLGKLSEEIDQYISSLSKHDDENSKPPGEVPIIVEQFAVLFESKIDDYDSTDNPVKWTRLTDEDSDSFLAAVNRISKLSASLTEFSSDSKYAYSINRIGSILQRAMTYLEEEFRSLLEDYKIPDHRDPHHTDSKPQDVSSSSTVQDGAEHPLPPPATAPGSSENIIDPHPEPEDNNSSNNDDDNNEKKLSDLSKLTKAMIVGGYETECCQIYFITRRNSLEETLHKFGFDKYSIDDVQKMNWESLEREIEAWIKTFKQCTTLQLSRERKLSDAVFADYPAISEALFSSLSRGVIVQLLNFSEAVAMSKRAAEKLFKFLDIYEALRDVLPKMDNLLPPQCLDEIKSEAALTRSRLGEATITIFCELENSIHADTGKTPVPGGAVHPLTRYTMNYMKYACEYKDTLEQVFREHQKIERADSGTGSDFDYNSQQANAVNQKAVHSPFQMQLIKIMDLLDSNLEGKSKLYKDLSLSSIFMMNNGRYILQKIRGSSEINSLMGDTWSRKRSSELRQYHKNYQRETWGKPLNCLMNHEGLNVNGKVVKPVLKERFKSFNAMFDEILKTQTTWVVSDEQLQSELRVSISNMVIPAYRAFMARYGQHLTPGRQTEKYVKYQPEDIETYLDELFDGNATPTGRRKL